MASGAWIAGGAALGTGAVMLLTSGSAWVALVSGSMAAVAAGYMVPPPRPEPAEARPAPPPQPVPPPPPQPEAMGQGAGRALLEALPVGVLLVGPDRVIRFVNGAAVEMCNLRIGAGRDVSALRVPALLELIETALRDGVEGEAEISLSRGSERFLRVQTCKVRLPVDDADGGVLVSIEDITQSRLANELHRDFVANASHELKTPLAAISAIIETLQGHAREDPAASERFLNLMASQSVRMTRLVEDLLSLNRIELNERVVPRAPEHPVRVISEVADTLSAYAETAGVRLELVLPDPGPVVLADRDELGQLFRNLIDNAIKYGGRGTTVTLSYLEPRAEAPRMAGFVVADEGPGIAREHIPRLTERFYRVSVSGSREKGGTGLGLAIVKHATNRHRGRLEITSTPGEGSRFTVWLPLAAESHAAVQKPGLDSAVPSAAAE